MFKITALLLFLVSSISFSMTKKDLLIKNTNDAEELLFFYDLMRINVCTKNRATCKSLNLNYLDAKKVEYKLCGCNEEYPTGNCNIIELAEVLDNKGKVVNYKCNYLL